MEQRGHQGGVADRRHAGGQGRHQSGDLIFALDGEPVQGLTLQEAVEKMRGKVGTPIKISIRRGAKDRSTSR